MLDLSNQTLPLHTHAHLPFLSTTPTSQIQSTTDAKNKLRPAFFFICGKPFIKIQKKRLVHTKKTCLVSLDATILNYEWPYVRYKKTWKREPCQEMTVLDIHLHSHKCVSTTKKEFTIVKQVCVMQSSARMQTRIVLLIHLLQFWYFTVKQNKKQKVKIRLICSD